MVRMGEDTLKNRIKKEYFSTTIVDDSKKRFTSIACIPLFSFFFLEEEGWEGILEMTSKKGERGSTR